MAALIFDMTGKIVLAFLLSMLVCMTIPDVFGAHHPQSEAMIVLAFYIYNVISMLLSQTHHLFHVVAIPVLSQFLHLFQRYSFEAGANSTWRLLPYILVGAGMLKTLILARFQLPRSDQLMVLIWMVVSVSFILISANLENILFGGLLLYVLVLPLCYVYFKMAASESGFRFCLEKVFAFLFVTLALGTFGLVFAGANYVGSDNLLATRNIADTNVTMAYFLLLWPLTLYWASKTDVPVLAITGMIMIFLSLIVLSFSRGAALIVLPFILTSLLTVVNAGSLIRIAGCVALFVFGLSVSAIAAYGNELLYFWDLRFGGLDQGFGALGSLWEVSGRREIHQIAFDLFKQKPLFGHGIGSFQALGPGYREAHSLFYTLLAEQGLAGTVYIYMLLLIVLVVLARSGRTCKQGWTMLLGFLTFLLFNHSVGSVFVVLPARSVTVSCIAPILLLALFFYARSEQPNDFVQ